MRNEREYRNIFIYNSIAIIIFTILIKYFGVTKYIEMPKVTLIVWMSLLLEVISIYFWWIICFSVEGIFFTKEKYDFWMICLLIISVVPYIIIKENILLIIILLNSLAYIFAKIMNTKIKKSTNIVSAKIIDVKSKKYVSGGIGVRIYTYHTYVLENTQNKQSYLLKQKPYSLNANEKLEGVVLFNKIFWNIHK